MSLLSIFDSERQIITLCFQLLAVSMEPLDLGGELVLFAFEPPERGVEFVFALDVALALGDEGLDAG